MSRPKIVTDSAAELDPQLAKDLDITIVPLQLNLGSETVVDGPAQRSAEFYHRMQKAKITPTVIVPTVKQFSEVYTRLAAVTGDIVSIHLSAAFNRTMRNAVDGRAGLLGRCQINVIDSQFISRAQGLLVVEAAKAAQAGMAGADIVRYVRGLLANTYMIFYLESYDYLKRNNLVQGLAIPATLTAPAVKPLLMLEEGNVSPLQRLRNRGTPAERLLEFVSEFTTLKHLSISHTGNNPYAAELKEMLGQVFPKELIEEEIYSPVLASYLGPQALIVTAFEKPGGI